jgi:S1-C subfamily serine protease
MATDSPHTRAGKSVETHGIIFFWATLSGFVAENAFTVLPTLRSPRLSSAAAVAAAGLIALLVATQAEAVIVTGTAGNNTAAPADSALAIRWGQVGVFRPTWGPDGFLGTPISSNVFITAKHIAGSVGDKITMADGTQHTTIAMFNDPSSDLALWQIADTFPSSLIVPLYTAGANSTWVYNQPALALVGVCAAAAARRTRK